MTLDFSRVNWLYVAVAVGLWLLAVYQLWRRPNGSLSEQFQSFKRQFPSQELTYEEWLSLGPPTLGRSVPPGRREPILLLSVAFWALLAITLVFGLGVVRW